MNLKRLLLSLVLLIFSLILVLRNSSNPPPKKTVAPSKSETVIPEIKDYAVSHEHPPLFYDFDGDGTQEMVVAYYGTTAGKSESCQQTKPVLLKIFSANKEAFSLESGVNVEISSAYNEINHLSLENNLGGKATPTVYFAADSSACGSGWTSFNYLISFHPDSGRFRIDLMFPSNELTIVSIKDWLPKYPGREILTSDGKNAWEIGNLTESHFSAHRQDLKIYYWKGENFVSSNLGRTNGKYFGEREGSSVEEILRAETEISSILNSL